MSKPSRLKNHDKDSSSLLLDVQHFEGLFFLLSEPEARSDLDEYNLNLSLSSIIPLSIMLLIILIPFFCIVAMRWNQLKTRHDYMVWWSSAVIMLLINFLVWAVYYYYHRIRSFTGSLPRRSKIFLVRFQMAVFLFVEVMSCCRLFVKVAFTHCSPTISDGDGSCNSLADSHAIPESASIVVMLVPILYTVFDRGTHFPFSGLLWFLSIGALVISTIYMNAINSIAYIIYYSLGSFLILIESRRSNIHLFITHRKLREMLKQREKEADAANAHELRHMIANVAHDLKTPLSSFLSGIEFISQVISDLADKKASDTPFTVADIEDCIQSVNHCVTNMRNTNSFMLMTINRCIDYTKASNGVKLVPKHETIDLLETLSLPLNCMKDIQQRVPIILEPLHRQLCSHIITDRQWLQENILCLLSNAAKYSNAGMVTINVTVSRLEKKDVLRRLHERSPKENVKKPEKHVRSRPVGKLVWKGFRLARVYHDSVEKDPEAPPPVTEDASNISSTDAPLQEHHSIREEDNEEARFVEYLRVEVEDHGIGLSDEAMSTLFNPFKQAQRLAGGTGLGLYSLAKRIEALDGFCGVQRRRDGQEGSLFWFEIPYRPDKQSSKMLNRYLNSVRRTPSNHEVPIFGSNAYSYRSTRSEGHSVTSYHLRREMLVAKPSQDGHASDTVGAPSLEISILSKSTEKVPGLQSASSREEADDLKSLDILVVDDSPAILKMTSMMLRRHKHSVIAATNGAEALKMVSERMESAGRSFDVVLMDLQMPVMDGLEATRRLRALEATKLISTKSHGTCKIWQQDEPDALYPEILHSQPCTDIYTGIIIGVSANSDAETTREAYKMGVDAFMAKPFSLETFYRTYDEVISQREVQE